MSSRTGAASAAPHPSTIAAELRELRAPVRDRRARLDHLIHIGELLNQARPQIGYGKWDPWLKRNSPVSRAQSNRCMKLAANQERIAGAGSIEEALAIVSPPRVVRSPPRRTRTWNGRSPTSRENELRAAVQAGLAMKHADLARRLMELTRVVASYEAVLAELDANDVIRWRLADLTEDLVTGSEALDRMLWLVLRYLGDAEARDKIARLRNVNGRPAAEAQNALRLADKLERRLENVLVA